MRHILKVFMLLMALVIQSTWIKYTEILGVTPNLVLALVVAMGLISEPVEAGTYGFAAGVLWDLMWGRVFGVNALLFMYIVLLGRALIELMYKKGLFVSVMITFFSAILYEILFFLISFAIWGETGFLYLILRIIIPSSAYTAAVGIPVFGLVNLLLLGRGERGGGYEV